MKKNFFILTVAIGLFLFNSCGNKQAKDAATTTAATTEEVTTIPDSEIIVSKVLTQEEQQKLTPAEVLDILKKGNDDFVNDNLTVRNNSAVVRDASLGQFPKAAIISCLDSRVPVEDVFHRGIGDLFVGRVAGNIVNEDMLGSLEFACKVSGAKLIVVLGHEYCGAVKAAIDDVKLGNITAMLAKIRPAVEEAKVKFEGEKTAANPAFVEAVCDHNVLLGIKNIRTKSPILKEMEDKGELKIVGGVYDMKTGKVNYIAE